MKTQISAKFLFIVVLIPIYFDGCNGANFSNNSGNGNRPEKSNPRNGASTPASSNPGADAPGNLTAHFQFSSGAKTLALSASFSPTGPKSPQTGDYTQAFQLVPGSVTSTPAAGFPADLAQQIAASPIAASVQHITAQNAYVIQLTVSLHGLVENGKPLPDQQLNLTQTNPSQTWSKSEGAVSALGSLQDGTSTSASCVLNSSGEQPHSGTYYVALTRPSDCDFKLPKVKVAGKNFGSLTDVAIGTYWLSSGGAAHTFPIAPVAPMDSFGNMIDIDNGFILVQPDHTSYLLVDAGHVTPHGMMGNSLSAATVANQISQTLGYGATTLLQPSAGSPADNYAGATVFKKGSVIAIYDDTPDLGGQIDVTALVTGATPASGINLNWDASVK